MPMNIQKLSKTTRLSKLLRVT